MLRALLVISSACATGAMVARLVPHPHPSLSKRFPQSPVARPCPPGLLRVKLPPKCNAEAQSPDGFRAQIGAGAQTALSLGGVVAADSALRRAFAAQAIAFPSSLAGFFLTFTVLTTLQSLHPPSAERLFRSAQPGCAFLAKWLAVFFVPNLVLLPLVITMGSADLARLGVLVLCGIGTSLPLAAFAASAAPAAPPAAPPAGAVTSTPAKPAPPFSAGGQRRHLQPRPNPNLNPNPNP